MDMSQHYELRDEFFDDKEKVNTRKLLDMETPIESVAVAIILTVTSRTRNRSLRALHTGIAIASSARLNSDDVDCARALANMYLDHHYYNWGGESHQE